MRSRNEHQNPEASSYRELRLLSEVEGNAEVTQRQLSSRVGIALGLTNVLLRNLTQKGYVRVARASWKRRLYTLTPEGFARRLRLMVSYIHRVLDDYQGVRQTLREQLAPLALNKESRVAIYGTGEFAELVYLGLKEIGIEEMDVFAPNASPGSSFLGMPVHDVESLRPQHYDRIVFALLDGWQAPYKELLERGVGPDDLVAFFADDRDLEEG